MRDKIKAMFLEQKRFGIKFRDYDKFEQHEFNNLILSTLDEVHSLLNTTSFKQHRKSDIETIKSNQLEELVDILKYWMELVLYLKFSWGDIEKEFWRKSAVCEQRYKQEWIEKLENYVIVDIDGVLTNYPFGFTSSITAIEPKKLKMFDLSSELSIPLKTLKFKKHEWRQNGGYAKLGVNIDGIDVVKFLKNFGYKIVLLSNRPVGKYKRIYADTMEWLDNNDIPYDALLFTDDEKGLKSIVKNAVFVVEDDPTQIQVYQTMGKIVFVPEKPYNGDIDMPNIYKYCDFVNFKKKFYYLRKRVG